MNQMIEIHISDEAGEFYSSDRWSNLDTPGSARVLSIGERVKSPQALAAFRSTQDGKFLLDVVDSFEDALNDEWMPLKIIGLPLDKAKSFIHAVWEELRESDVCHAVKNLKERYAQFSNP